jgi:hypothetical protein
MLLSIITPCSCHLKHSSYINLYLYPHACISASLLVEHLNCSGSWKNTVFIMMSDYTVEGINNRWTSQVFKLLCLVYIILFGIMSTESILIFHLDACL